MSTPSIPKKKRKRKRSHGKRSKSIKGIVSSLSADIKERWFHPDGHQISKTEIGLSLHRASLGPDGEPTTEKKRDVKAIVENLTESPKLASYSTIRGWITAARKATMNYGDTVEKNFEFIERLVRVHCPAKTV